MNNVSTERAEEIFCAAIELESEAERTAFVRASCAGDDALREAVEHMLVSFSGGQRLLDAACPTSVSVVELARTVIDPSGGAMGADNALPDDGEVGRQIGLYKLLKRIGEGGGGSVYLAEQEKPVRRQVALKIIKLGMDTKSVIARFEAERQALAMMEHPNIAHVLNAGATDEGRPFFVMELVQGTEITTYCNEHGLDITRRLQLFIQICHAIQHAHQKGIIHRDIKPSNIIITELDGDPLPKVIDFGIAKATSGQQLSDNTAYTACEQFIGTPAYMSPEQADLAEQDIDVRSDIYSLGVLLYELLTGQTPFDQKKLIRSGLEEMRRTIRHVEPPRPSARLAAMPAGDLETIGAGHGLSAGRLLALLEGDLDWIVMKAMEKDRDRRYGSADGLADDIQRYLNHEPVNARPPSRVYRLRKLVRRNKGVFTAGTFAAAVLLLSATVSTWLLVRERIAQQRASYAEQEADVLRVSVESQQKVAKALVLFRRGEMEQADAILDDIVNVQASPGNASMFREIGDWHALNERWEKAKARFDVLLHINEFEGADSTMDDSRSAALLVEQGYLEGYERFRESLVNRYAGIDNPTTAQRVIRECILVPANDELMLALHQFAGVIEESYRENIHRQDEAVMRWQAYAMALLAYRQGAYEQAMDWCEKADLNDSYFPTRALSVQLIRAMALARLGRMEEARAQLETTRLGIERFFASNPEESKVWQGFWFDRAFVRIHQSEAEALILPEPAVTD